MIESLFEKKIIDHTWPVYVNGKLFEGSKFGSHSLCNEQCRIGENGVDSNVCEHGLTHISRKINGSLVQVSGVFISTNVASKKYKKNALFMQRKVTSDAIKDWFINLDEKSSAIQSLVTKTAKSNFDQFHEFVKWAREIGHYTERVLGKSTVCKASLFENASEDLKSLYKTSVMLLDSLDTTALYFNPESAKFGRKGLTDIYSMVYKIKLVLSHSRVNKRRANVVIKGRVANKHKVYESFKIIPLSLIQNAIKYRRSGDVEVVFNENGNELDMSVISIGDYIPDNEITELFCRGYRTSNARKMSIEGSGLGLYVLKIVTDVHDFRVSVTSEKIQPTNKNLARNTFTVSIH
ncbi:TPA: ATP-binding protein [Photobacterium damselae]